MCAKFEGNPIACLHFMVVFASVQKENENKNERENKNEGDERLFEGSYIRNG